MVAFSFIFRYDALCEQCELKENEARLLKSKIEHSNHHKQLEELEKLKQSLGNYKIFDKCYSKLMLLI